MTEKAQKDVEQRQKEGYVLVYSYESKQHETELLVYILPSNYESGDIVTITHVFNGKHVHTTTIPRFVLEQVMQAKFDREMIREAV